MRLLVLGGTRFVGWAVAAEGLARGHDVTCVARGQSGSVPEGATLVQADRDLPPDQPGGLAALGGAEFDAVVDVATMSYPWVADALAVLGDRVGHWTFVSTLSVYAENDRVGVRPGDPVLEPLREGPSEADPTPERYGRIKVASEDAVRAAMGERAFVVRPGLITGPGDPSDRFGYWPGRLARGGRVVVPDTPDQLAQYIDVRDLADWIVTATEQRLAGTYNGIGPTQRLGPLLAGIAAEVGTEVELVPVDPEVLVAAGVNYWSGPKSLPLWLPASHSGFGGHDAAEALAAGLSVRALADAVAGALATERELGLDRDRKAGLTPAEEAAILAGLS